MAAEVRVFQTTALTEYCEREYGEDERWRAAERVTGLLEFVWERTDYIDADVEATVGPESIDAPTETTAQAFHADAEDPDAPDPACVSGESVTYSNLLDWWESYVGCHDVPTVADSNLLLTDGTAEANGIAVPAGEYATASYGRHCAEAPDAQLYRRSPIHYGDGDPYLGMSLAVHEIGHNLMEGLRHHYRGRVYERRHPLNPTRERHAVSPMSASPPTRENMVENDGANHCGTDNEGLIELIDAYDLQYSPCSVELFSVEADATAGTADATDAEATATAGAESTASADGEAATTAGGETATTAGAETVAMDGTGDSDGALDRQTLLSAAAEEDDASTAVACSFGSGATDSAADR